MPVLEFTQETMPKTRAEFTRLLEAARENANPLDDLLSLSRQLFAFEQRYEMTSDDFYVRYKRGELGDSMDFIRWAGRYRLYRELRDEINYQRADSRRVFRYDNAPHHRELPGFPEHKHEESRIVSAGAPDLNQVLREIDSYLYHPA